MTPADRSALLLSGSLGMGHDVMAEACALSLQDRGWQHSTLDCMRLLGDAGGNLGERAFRLLMDVPGVYDAFHFGQLRPGGRLAVMAENASCRYLVPALAAELDARPAQLLISVFATGAAAASRLKADRPDLITWVFCTDVCPHRLWVHANTDLYLVTSETAARYVRRFQPRAQVAVVPTPVRPQFYAAPDQASAREQLHIPPDAPCVLLMSGSWGLGPLVELARTLAVAGIHVLAVAGRNAATEAALRVASESHPTIRAFGFTDQIPALMAASDLVITSSGDTCSEARVIGRSLLLLDVVPGHGRENLQHELELGNAEITSTEPAMLTQSVLASLEKITAPTTRIARNALQWEQAFEMALAAFGLSAIGASQS